MNHLGFVFVWIAAQITLFLIPAVLVHCWASRRGPAAGAWAAALGLMLCMLLPLAGVIPAPALLNQENPSREPTVSSPSIGGNVDEGQGHGGFSLDLTPLLARWSRFRSQLPISAASSEGFIQIGTGIALVAVFGVSLGLARLLLGLWAVRLCRRRCRPVTDADLAGILDELRLALGFDRKIVLVESPELGTPATAGWRRPVIMLPDDWQAWDHATRRAVLAHELAHIARADYATGLIARLATAIHFYHPLIHWMARRLQLQQELAADAMGVRLGGGRVSYLLALSRLALRQDGRLPCWPARAFLPPRGTLIRRMSMLRNESMTTDQTTHHTLRWLTAGVLVALALGAAMLRDPARADDKATTTNPPPAQTASTASNWLYVPEKSDGLIMLRPAAALRRMNRPGLADLASRTFGLELAAGILGDFGLDPKFLLKELARPSLSFSDIECVTAGFKFGIGKSRKKNGEEEKLHSIMASGAMVRTVAPFDWIALFRKWGVDCTEVRMKHGACYELKSPITKKLGIQPCIYLPDDRTIVMDMMPAIEKLAERGKPELPAHLAGEDWKTASKGILAVAYRKPDDFEKSYNLGRPDDAVVISLLDGVERVVLSAADAEQIALHAVAACSKPDAPEKIARVVQSLKNQGIKAVEANEVDLTPMPMQLEGVRLAKGLLYNLRIVCHPASLTLDSSGFGTLAEFASVVEEELKVSAEQIDKEIARATKDGGEKRTK